MIKKLLMVLLMSGFIATSFALRCGNKLISVGDNQDTVLAACGKPASKKTSSKEEFFYNAKGGIANKTRTIDFWTYNFGLNKFMSVLIFENGSLIKGKTGDYGH